MSTRRKNLKRISALEGELDRLFRQPRASPLTIGSTPGDPVTQNGRAKLAEPWRARGNIANNADIAIIANNDFAAARTLSRLLALSALLAMLALIPPAARLSKLRPTTNLLFSCRYRATEVSLSPPSKGNLCSAH